MGEQHDERRADRKHTEQSNDADLDPAGGEVTDERSVSSIPLDTEDGGQVVITQQNMGPDNQVGGGEWKDVDRGPTPDEAAAAQAALERRSPTDDADAEAD
jgi:hypothetical protein